MKYQIQKKIIQISFVLLCFISNTVFAASSPIDVVQTTSDQMLSQLSQHKATLKTDPNVVYNIVNRVLLPHADLTTMSKLVVGRNAWLGANPADRQAFIQQFTMTLMRTYASALASYSNQTVKVYPIRGGFANQSQVQVNTAVTQPDGPPIPVSYRLANEGGVWKLIDFSVDGVSIVENYRAQFASDLNSGSLAMLTQKLSQHNAQVSSYTS